MAEAGKLNRDPASLGRGGDRRGGGAGAFERQREGPDGSAVVAGDQRAARAMCENPTARSPSGCTTAVSGYESTPATTRPRPMPRRVERVGGGDSPPRWTQTAVRTATSRERCSPRRRKRSATLAHATSSRNPIPPRRIQSTPLTSLTTASFRDTTPGGEAHLCEEFGGSPVRADDERKDPGELRLGLRGREVGPEPRHRLIIERRNARHVGVRHEEHPDLRRRMREAESFREHSDHHARQIVHGDGTTDDPRISALASLPEVMTQQDRYGPVRVHEAATSVRFREEATQLGPDAESSEELRPGHRHVQPFGVSIASGERQQTVKRDGSAAL